MIPLYQKVINHFRPNILWSLYAHKSNKILKESYLILSFDCDTELDIQCVESVHDRLQSIGITPVYAVPGELLIKGQKTYKNLFQKGAEFINHGHRSHTIFDDSKQTYKSTFFYDQHPLSIIEQDIYKGHQTIMDILNTVPIGFRTPHFGTFQNKDHLSFLYKTLQQLNYQFSTSTSPDKGYRHGPIYTCNGILEIPVTGIWCEPLNIMDSWGFYAAPDRQPKPDSYLETAINLATFAKSNNILINIYADPSQIVDKDEFFKAIKHMINYAKPINYQQLLHKNNFNYKKKMVT